jgi:hypothetical protein
MSRNNDDPANPSVDVTLKKMRYGGHAVSAPGCCDQFHVDALMG